MRKWTVTAAVIALTAAFTGPAHAFDNSGKYSTEYVDGGGVILDDFGDHARELGGSLCHGCSNSWNTDTVLMWQAILMADGLLSSDGLDGRFGPNTKEATEEWQDRRDLSVDGMVGPQTWDAADEYLRFNFDGRFVKYRGETGNVTFRRGGPRETYDGGAYYLEYVTSGDRSASFYGGTRIQHDRRTVYVR
ncbi:putative peptidoglycan binding protein [Haloactinopolyspora alba]|uniref:Putative peptidoglycan binding protein n=1 Tax=Haloactinopolyspora alba TaxID=648780 RepID=A0A2P8D3B4_9ACTN|nr:peptidoglycan-binding domain-containing protein [Haloactinopolyspora alba]PSK91708.1 putative peptidoglycan binding protein [Haloactinopolyspora alba]